jgi:uncharacterized protein YktA (UPF0223 family)
MSIPNTKVQEFCHAHRIRVIDTNKRAHKYQKISLDFFRDPGNFDKVYNHIDVVHDTEPLYTIEITESELERISEFESQVFNNLRESGHYRMFETIMEQKEHEKRLRERYPAVKKAFEHYSLILKLAQSGEL